MDCRNLFFKFIFTPTANDINLYNSNIVHALGSVILVSESLDGSKMFRTMSNSLSRIVYEFNIIRKFKLSTKFTVMSNQVVPMTIPSSSHPTVRLTRRHFLLTIISVLLGFSYGCSYVITILRVEDVVKSFLPRKIAVNVLIVTFTSGAMCSSLMTVVLNDKLRRRVVILMACVILMIGEAVTAAAITAEFMLFGRFIAGVGVGKMLN